MSKRFTVKVFVSGITDAGDGQKNVQFTADYADDRNKEWAKYTPALNLQMVVLDEVAEGISYGDKFTGTFEASED